MTETPSEVNPTPEEPTEPETEPTEPTEQDEESSATEPSADTSPEPEPEEPKTYAGVKPLESLESVVNFADGDGTWLSDDDFSIEENADESTRSAKTIARATTTLANAYRNLCYAILAFRCHVSIERKDATIGPDWAGDSQLSQRYTALTVYKPLAEAGYDSAKIRSVMNQVSVYMGRKLPGRDITLRDDFMQTHYREILDLAGEAYQPAEILDRIDAESRSTGLKSGRMVTQARQANAAGPGSTTPASPLPAITNAVTTLVNSTAELSDAALLQEAHRILTKVARRVYSSDGHWTDRPQAVTILGHVQGLVDALVLNIEGDQTSWEGLLQNVYGAAKARESFEAEKAAADAVREAEATPDAEEEATADAAVEAAIVADAEADADAAATA